MFTSCAGSFAAAAGLQMRFDRVHALSQASHFTQRRAREFAADLLDSLDLQPQHGQPVGQFLRSPVEVDVLFEPVERDLHY